MKHTFKAVTMGLALTALAAGTSSAAHEIGVKGGVAIQNLGGEPLEDYDIENRTGFAGGAYFQCNFTDNFGVRLEGLYIMKGATADSADIDVTLKLDYVEFPLLVVGRVPLSETAHLNLFGGPTFSFNTKSEVEVSVSGFSGTFDLDSINSFDFGLTFGAGLSFDIGSVVLGFDGRYGFGLSSIIDEDELADEGITLADDDDIKNQGFAFMASIGIPIGGASE